jgi:hypothetical protein
MEFLKNGEMNYSGALSGRFAGMKLKGSGTWRVENDWLEYMAGADKGRDLRHWSMAMCSLFLRIDPGIRRDGVSEVDTTYIKSRARLFTAPLTND